MPSKKGTIQGSKRTPKTVRSDAKEVSEKQRVRRFTVRRVVYWASALGVWGLMLGMFGFLYLAHDLPDLENLPAPGAGERAVVVKAANGATLARSGPVYGDWIPFRELPDSVVRATLAIEDRSFFEHLGVDGKGLARAALANLQAGRVRAGGSTITQQLAKNLFLTSRQTLTRKAQEMLMAVWLEHTFTKQEILSLYLNRVYFGYGAYGIDAAARRYFGHGARSLSVTESALLAGLLKAPSRLAPHINPDGAWERAQLVLGAMVEVGALTPEAGERLKRRQPTINRPKAGRHVYYFTDWIVAETRKLGDRVANQSIIVHTTLDPTAQRAAADALTRGLSLEGKAANASEGAVIAIDHDGAVRAMVGGSAYRNSQFNRATDALRQPGSAFKLFAYLAALERGLDPQDMYIDAPVTVEGWSPKNYTGRFSGQMTAREAFARSINTVAVKISENVGRGTVKDMAKRMGISTPVDAIPSLPLGTEEVKLLDLASAYGIVASGGYVADAYAITEITSLGGEVLYRRRPSKRFAVVSRSVVTKITDMLTAVVTWGSGKAARIDRPAAGKTGTSQDSRDAVFVGFTSDMTAAVWVGNDNGSAMKNVTGGGLPARIWADFMIEAHAGLPARPLLADADLYERSGR